MLVAKGLSPLVSRCRRQAVHSPRPARIRAAAGGLTVIGGPSGSGKSTLLYVLAGLLPPDAGIVRIGDRRPLLASREPERFLAPRARRLRLSGFPPASGAFAARQRHGRRDLLPLVRATFGAAGASSSSGSACRSATVRWRRCRAASGSAWRSRARSSSTRRSSLPTSRPPRSTSPPAPECSGRCSDLAREGKTVVMVSHEPRAIAAADVLLTLERGHVAEPQRAAA